MSKTQNNISAYIEPELLQKLNEYCKENAINKSALVRKLIRKEVAPKTVMAIDPGSDSVLVIGEDFCKCVSYSDLDQFFQKVLSK